MASADDVEASVGDAVASASAVASVVVVVEDGDAPEASADCVGSLVRSRRSACLRLGYSLCCTRTAASIPELVSRLIAAVKIKVFFLQFNYLNNNKTLYGITDG